MHGFPIVYSPFYPLLSVTAAVLLIASVMLWTIILKGYALWAAARGGQKTWFVALLILNTFGILEIVYLIWYRPKAKSADESAPIISSSVQS
jgi:methionyl-tRNA synthetase